MSCGQMKQRLSFFAKSHQLYGPRRKMKLDAATWLSYFMGLLCFVWPRVPGICAGRDEISALSNHPGNIVHREHRELCLSHRSRLLPTGAWPIAFILKQNGWRKHRAVLKWPAMSMPLNLTEHLWDGKSWTLETLYVKCTFYLFISL